MRMLITAATAALAAAATAQAETHVATDGTMAGDAAMTETMPLAEMDRAQLIRTRDITGGAIYTTDEADDEGWDTAEYTEVGANWNQIGEIEDIILDRSGQMIGVIGEVGGFLDIGDTHVMIPVADVRLVPVDDRSYTLVTRLNEEELEALPDVDEGFWD